MAKTAIENDDAWVCRNCYHKGDFKLHGKGIVECSNCGSIHFVSSDGSLFLIEVGRQDSGSNKGS